MSEHLSKPYQSPNRKAFIGGSDARIIMGDDEVALQRLWREKRGDVDPEDLSGNLIVGAVIRLYGGWQRRSTVGLKAATCRIQVHAALAILGGSGGAKIYAATAA
jgi:hypothetical protein